MTAENQAPEGGELIDLDAIAEEACLMTGNCLVVTLADAKAAVEAALAAQPQAALEYQQANPLGGPAKAFRAMADAIEAGDSYEDTLRRYRFAEVKPSPAEGDTLPLPRPNAQRAEWDERPDDGEVSPGWWQYHDESDPLPKRWDDEAPTRVVDLFTADQMRAYALAASNVQPKGVPAGWRIERTESGGISVMAPGRSPFTAWADLGAKETTQGLVWKLCDTMLSAAPTQAPAPAHLETVAYVCLSDDGIEANGLPGLSCGRRGEPVVWRADAEAAIRAAQAPAVGAVKVWCEMCNGSGKVFQEHQAGCWVGGDKDCPDCDGQGFSVRSGGLT